MSLIKDLLANAGGITAAFDKNTPAGTAVQGVITSAEVRQTTDFDTGKPETWDDGTPKQQLVIVVQTEQRTAQDDDGKRAIYIKWWGEQRLNLIKAIEKAGDDDVQIGGQFWARFAATKPNEKNPRLSDIKVYEYAYQKPANTAGLNMNASQPPQQAPVQQQQAAPGPWDNVPQTAPVQQAAPAPENLQNPYTGTQGYDPQQQAAAAAFQQGLPAQQAPVQQAPVQQAAPAAGGADIGRIQQFISLGMNDAEIAGALGLQPEQVAAVRNLPAQQ